MGFFAKLAKQRLKRGVFRCVVDLQATINRFVAETNHDPKPFTWTADPDKIIAAVRRGHQVLDSIHWPSPANLLTEHEPLIVDPIREVETAQSICGACQVAQTLVLPDNHIARSDDTIRRKLVRRRGRLPFPAPSQ